MAALLLHRAFLWISTISTAFLNLQLLITNEFNGFKSLEKTTTKYIFYWCWKKWQREPTEGGFRLHDYFWIRPGRCSEWWDIFVTGRVATDEYWKCAKINRCYYYIIIVNENSAPCVRVLHKTLNWSFHVVYKNNKEMCQKKRTCWVVVLLIKAFVLWRSR